jgi:hypothetical protein
MSKQIEMQSSLTRNFLIYDGETFQLNTYGEVAKMIAQVLVTDPETKQVERFRFESEVFLHDLFSTGAWILFDNKVGEHIQKYLAGEELKLTTVIPFKLSAL